MEELIVTIKDIKPEKKTRTTVDTICFSRKECEKWLSPPFQRELKLTAKVREIAEEIAQTAVIPGVLTLGKLKGDVFLLDGQHRRAAFLLTDLPEGYADVRIHAFDTMAEMGEEFVRLNTQLVRLKPDDVLRGMEGTYPPIRFLREKCPFIGYDNIRRGDRTPIVSMSQFLRAWMGSRPETPQASPGSAMSIAQSLTQEEAAVAAKVGNILFGAWGRTDDTRRLWSGLNLIMVFWMYRRLVLTVHTGNQSRIVKINDELFSKCCAALGANDKYNDWLVGRVLNERNRSPAMHRIKDIFARRIMTERGLSVRPSLPQPPWATHGGRSSGV
jgi:hypothetical protein